MSFTILTVGDLKKFIEDENISDDTPVVLAQGSDAGSNFEFEVSNGVYITDDEDKELLNRTCIILTSGYLSKPDLPKDPVIRSVPEDGW